MINYFIGIDNGVTATFGILGGSMPLFGHVPVKTVTDYNKGKKKNIGRINVDAFYRLIDTYLDTMNCPSNSNCFAVIERPMKNSMRFDASISGARAYEAVLILLENIGIGYDTIDSGKWQKMLLPAGLKGSDQLKKASKDIGIRMFPQFKEQIEKHGDADGILIAEYCRLTYK